MKVKNLAEVEGFSALSMPNGDREITGGYCGDLLSWVMGRAESGCAWITIMSNINIAAVAALADVACVILAESVSLEQAVIDTAFNKGINILVSRESAFDIAAFLGRELAK